MRGVKEEKSKVPRCKWVTGIEMGESSEESTEAKDVKAETIRDSGEWKAGVKEEIIEGVRTRTDGFSGVEGAAGLE